jgi:uncharacterized integral membrane protein
VIDGALTRTYRRRTFLGMNAKILFKTIFLMAVLLLLVMMGMNNRSSVSFALPPILPKAISQPGAIMYFAFFAAGVITGTVLTAGGGKSSGGGGSGSAKPSKPSKS